LQHNTVHWFATDDSDDGQSTSRGIKRKLDFVCEEDRRLDDCPLDDINIKRDTVCQHYERWSAVENLLHSNDVDY